MNSFPDIIRCLKNQLLFKKVSPSDIDYIWETAPLEELFLVTGCEASNSDELKDVMQLDWTTWFLMMDEQGYTYGLIRAVPEIDSSISLHGIGWTQPQRSPRIFVLSWYAFHYLLFSRNYEIVKTYCDAENTNAINFDLKTGYTYDYCMPSGVKGKKNIHLKLEKKPFDFSLEKKRFDFSLTQKDFASESIPVFVSGKSITNRAKNQEFTLRKLEPGKEHNDFFHQHFNDNYFYYTRLVPQPFVYRISIASTQLGYLLLSEINNKKKLIIFNLAQAQLNVCLEQVKFMKNTLQIK